MNLFITSAPYITGHLRGGDARHVFAFIRLLQVPGDIRSGSKAKATSVQLAHL